MAHNLSSAWLSSVCSSSEQRRVCPELHRHHRLEAPSPEYLSAGPSLAQQLYLAVGNRSGRGPCLQPAVRASPPCAWLRHSSPSRFAVPLSPLPAPVPQDPCSLQAHLWIANNTLTRMLPSAGDARLTSVLVLPEPGGTSPPPCPSQAHTGGQTAPSRASRLFEKLSTSHSSVDIKFIR